MKKEFTTYLNLIGKVPTAWNIDGADLVITFKVSAGRPATYWLPSEEPELDIEEIVFKEVFNSEGEAVKITKEMEQNIIENNIYDIELLIWEYLTDDL